MNVSNPALRSLNAIEPSIVATYLEGNGWENRGRYKDLASIWKLKNSEQNFTILLPDRSDMPDYPNRLYEIFLILEKVENRPGSEIVESLRSSSQVAREMQREIISIRLQSHEEGEQNEIPAKHLADILKHTQELFDAIGQVESGQSSSRGRIKQQIKEQTKLSVVNTFKGSFGLRLSAVSPVKHLDSGEEYLFQRVAKKFLMLLSYSNPSQKKQLDDLLFELQQKVASHYHRLLLSLHKAGTHFSVEWASIDPREKGSARISFEDLSKIAGTTETIEAVNIPTLDEYDREIVGELIVVDLELAKFKIQKIQDRKQYSGEICDDLMNQKIEFSVRRPYYATIQEVNSVSPATGERKTEYTLLDLRPYP